MTEPSLFNQANFTTSAMQNGMADKKVLSVSELNRLANQVLTQNFPLFWVSGEISNLTRAASGHWYFSLKDNKAQVRCVMFRGRNSHVDWTPQEGDKVEARCNVTLYEARGDFQLTVESLQRAGLGDLFEAFERLKRQLQTEGLFDADIKMPLPPLPQSIGIVTSPNAAALRDVLSTLKRRMPNIPIIIYPTPVQGKGAATLIANAIDEANERQECDVLIICRGGGSMEDLWQFNEEVVARAIANCGIPTVSGVGHETDFTISDFVADVRAATPTAAAELVTPSQAGLIQHLNQMQQQMNRLTLLGLEQRSLNLDHLSRRLVSPMQQLKQQQQSINELGFRLKTVVEQTLQFQRQQLVRLEQNLGHLNPLAVLTRGFALVENAQGEIVQSAKNLSTNDAVNIRFAEGEVSATVNYINPRK
jgi:exodeoxyribonuclease VII large subunit